MSDFFDQTTGGDDNAVPTNERPSGATVLINGSYQNLEVGAPFLQSMQNMALQAGLGKFKVWLNGVEVRPSSAPAEISADMSCEIRPFDEAG
jgi:hypothetical protein